MRIGQTSFVVFIAKFFSSFVGFIATIYITRTLGSSVFGEYMLAVSVIIWLQVFGVLGVRTAIKKRLSEAGKSDAYFTAGVGIVILTFLLISICILIFRSQINSYIGVPVAIYLPTLLLAGMSLSFVSASLQGTHKVHIAALLEPIDRTVRSISQITVVFFSIGLIGLLFSYVLGGIIAALCGLYYLSINISFPTKKEIRGITSYAQYAWLGKLSSRSFSAMDTVVLGVFVTSSFVAYYEVAWNLASLLAIVSIAIGQALFPEISQASSKGNVKQVEDLVTKGLTYAGLFLIPGLIGGIIIGDLVLQIYGDEFQKAASVLIILIIARLLDEYKNQFTTGINGIDRPDLAFRVNIVFIIMNICLNIGLIAMIGWVGAAIATSISAGSALVVSYYLCTQLIEVQIPIYEVIKQFVASICMGITILLGRRVFPETVYVAIGLVGIGGVIYILFLSAISVEFRTTIQNNIPEW